MITNWHSLKLSSATLMGLLPMLSIIQGVAAKHMVALRAKPSATSFLMSMASPKKCVRSNNNKDI